MRNKFGLVILGLALLGVSGCSKVPNAVNPISWYRDVTGISKNDDLGKGENEENLAEGGNEPYPNLGTVPALPDTQLSGVDRERLEKSLVADRNNAQYSADNLRAGDIASTVPPPAPPAPKPSTTSATLSGGSSSPPTPSSTPPAPPDTSSNALPPAASSPPPAPAPNPAVTASSAPPANSASPPPSAGSKIVGSNSQQKPPTRGSEAPPAESSLQSPTIANLPEGETATPAPPPPQVPPPNASRVANAAPPAAPAPAPRSSGGAPAQQATAPGTAPAVAAARGPAGSHRVADVSFAPGSAYLSGALRGTIAEVVKTHNTEGGRIRVVGFGEATGKDAAVAGLTLALDRAQAVAVALTDAGVAAKDVSVEAAPVLAKGGVDAPRAEVYIEH